jgi:hypothetical protein
MNECRMLSAECRTKGDDWALVDEAAPSIVLVLVVVLVVGREADDGR